jgi:thioredoxin-like negative regulator of GroEL
MTNQIEDITAVEFEDRVLRSHLPVLVDFHRSACLPCQKLSPAINELAQAYLKGEGQTVRVYKCDDDALFERLKVQFVPQLILFVAGHGHWIDRNIRSVEGLQKEIDEIVAEQEKGA